MNERQPVAPIFIPLRPCTDAEELERQCPEAATIHACDFYVTGAEHGIPEPGGFRIGRILNVDHHAPHPRMEQPVTSTGLAYEHLIAGGRPDPASYVIIHHTDCDSILSSAMLLGLLPADPDLVAASVAADHTGEENEIADLLQALDEGRRGDRTGVVPEAAVTMVASPNVADPARWTIKLRLGESAPPGLTLHALAITDWDPKFGGRWNAGSNGRGGGTHIEPELYAIRLRARLDEAMAAMPE